MWLAQCDFCRKIQIAPSGKVGLQPPIDDRTKKRWFEKISPIGTILHAYCQECALNIDGEIRNGDYERSHLPPADLN